MMTIITNDINSDTKDDSEKRGGTKNSKIDYAALFVADGGNNDDDDDDDDNGYGDEGDMMEGGAQT